MLTIAGTDYPVETANAGRDQPTLLGTVQRAFDGTLLLSVRGTKRGWHYTLPLTKAAADTLEADLAGAGLVTCAGADLPATGVYRVALTGWVNIEDTSVGDGFAVEATVTLTEP